MKNRAGLALAALICASITFSPARAKPPFDGTIFIDPDIITPADPTSFRGVTFAGRGTRTMFDRRVNAFVVVNDVYLFTASFEGGNPVEIQVNPELGSEEAAAAEAQRYGTPIGQLPGALRTRVETVWIHLGTAPFGGGNDNLLIHTGQAQLYERDGILEETLVHEASHTSLDPVHAAAPGWLAAQAADGEFISTYARDNPNQEDIAESFLPYLAVRYRPDRISASLRSTILQTIPARVSYFDDQSLDTYPIVDPRAPRFSRGDANADGSTDISDGIGILGYLFLGSVPPPCFSAADTNDSGQVDIADAVSLFGFLFLGGAPPAAPFADCGVDESRDGLSCLDYPPCTPVKIFGQNAHHRLSMLLPVAQ